MKKILKIKYRKKTKQNSEWKKQRKNLKNIEKNKQLLNDN